MTMMEKSLRMAKEYMALKAENQELKQKIQELQKAEEVKETPKKKAGA